MRCERQALTVEGQWKAELLLPRSVRRAKCTKRPRFWHIHHRQCRHERLAASQQVAEQRARRPSTGYGSGLQRRCLGRRWPIDAIAPARSNRRRPIGGTKYRGASKRREQEERQRGYPGRRGCPKKCAKLRRANGRFDVHLKGFLARQCPVMKANGDRLLNGRTVGKRCEVKMRINRSRKRGVHVQAKLFRCSEMAVQKRA